MFYVYLLKSIKNGSIYIGYTQDLKKRLMLHNLAKVNSTKLGKPWELIYYEAYKNKEDATHREKMLKQDGRSRTWLKKRTARSLKGAA
ncbi:MAG: GIY-YIG nuclease family protein [Patescibacteria group bacterium]